MSAAEDLRDWSKASKDLADKLGKLEALGSPDAIAWELEAQGIKGCRSMATRCAIAVYLTAGTEHERSAVVSGGCAGYTTQYFCEEVDGPRVRFNQMPLPEIVRRFVGKFDVGDYPALVRDDDADDW